MMCLLIHSLQHSLTSSVNIFYMRFMISFHVMIQQPDSLASRSILFIHYSRFMNHLHVSYVLSDDITRRNEKVCYRLLMSMMTEMLEKRWWCSVAVMVLFNSTLSLKCWIRIPRLCWYEYSDVMISKMACTEINTHNSAMHVYLQPDKQVLCPNVHVK